MCVCVCFSYDALLAPSIASYYLTGGGADVACYFHVIQTTSLYALVVAEAHRLEIGPATLIGYHTRVAMCVLARSSGLNSRDAVEEYYGKIYGYEGTEYEAVCNLKQEQLARTYPIIWDL
ncbi:hypothetical protein PC116_g26336 [Phytophthora cactorum]|nr:hypothetical protein PC116_g26336 [Phytophthora cactorum]